METLGAQLLHLEKLLARYDCRGRRLPPLQRSPADHQGEDALPNALEDILAFQGKSAMGVTTTTAGTVGTGTLRSCVASNFLF